jgi:hypothetical protein
MPVLATPNGPLHYEVIDHVAPWRARRPTVLFHHGIGASARIWAGWLPRLIGRYRVVTWEMSSLVAVAVGEDGLEGHGALLGCGQRIEPRDAVGAFDSGQRYRALFVKNEWRAWTLSSTLLRPAMTGSHP